MISDNLAASVLGVVVEAAGEVRRLFYSKDFTVSSKGEAGPLSTADLVANEILTEGLTRIDPAAAVLSEETVDNPNRLANPNLWVIDPIDGTREFVAGIPQFAVSVGRVADGRVVFGAVALPAENCIVTGGPGIGVRVFDLQGVEIRIVPGLSSRTVGQRLSVLVSSSEHRRGRFRALEEEFEIRPSGSIARKLALLAAGTGDLVISLYPKNDWDICGGTGLILGLPGGAVIDLRRKEARIFNTDDPLSFGLVAGPSSLVNAFVRVFEAKGLVVADSYE